MRLLLWQLRYEQKSYWRNPASAFFTFAITLSLRRQSGVLKRARAMPVLFLSGTFFPLQPDSTVSRIADVFPVRHFNLAVFGAFDPRGPHGVAHGFGWQHVAVMSAWAVVAAVIGVRRFRWEPGR